MRYQIIKVRNGLWKLRWENGKETQHSTQQGAEKQVMNVYAMLKVEDSEKIADRFGYKSSINR